MEKHNASLKISIICVKVFTLAMIVIALFAPKIFSRLIEVRIAYLGGKLEQVRKKWTIEKRTLLM